MGTKKTTEKQTTTPSTQVPPHTRTRTAEGWKRKREETLAEPEKGKGKKKS